jgi:regulator of replication initiation timing
MLRNYLASRLISTVLCFPAANEAQTRELNAAAFKEKVIDAKVGALQDSIVDMTRDREALDREHRDLIRQNGVLEAERRTLLKWRSAAKERHATLRAEFETAHAGSQALADLYARHVELDAERVKRIAHDEETIRGLEAARNELAAQMETLVAENNAVRLERDAARQEAADQEAYHQRALDRSAELLVQAEAAMQQRLDQNAELASKTQADMQGQLDHYMEEKEKLGVLVNDYRQASTKCTC